MTAPEYDLVVYGATGFTGKLVAQYLAESYASLPYALAGRSPEKLERLKSELQLPASVGVETADVQDEAGLRALVKKAKVFYNLAGPYSKHNGALVYRLCAEEGVSYIDLTGELPWSAKMMKEYHETAKKTGAIMMSSVGLDCMPSDLTVMLAVQKLREKSPSATPGHVVGALEVQGASGISGGTLNSIMEHVGKKKSTEDISESERKAGRISFLSKLPDGSYASLSPFGVPNAKYVHRTEDVLERLDPKRSYGPSFSYEEHWQHRSIFSALTYSLSLSFVGLLLAIPWTRALLHKYGPQSGEGPDYEKNRHATWALTAWAKSTDESNQSRATLHGVGHPGYSATAKMSVEAALAIAHDRSKLPALGKQGGVLTPASALGQVIVDRLEKTGDFKFVTA